MTLTKKQQKRIREEETFKYKLSSKDFICNNCGYIVEPIKRAKGSIGIEIFLWFLFLIPGIIYSCWRLGNKEIICPVCKSTNLIPIDSPKGQELIKSSKVKKYEEPAIPLWVKVWGVAVASIFIFMVIFLISSLVS